MITDFIQDRRFKPDFAPPKPDLAEIRDLLAKHPDFVEAKEKQQAAAIAERRRMIAEVKKIREQSRVEAAEKLAVFVKKDLERITAEATAKRCAEEARHAYALLAGIGLSAENRTHQIETALEATAHPDIVPFAKTLDDLWWKLNYLKPSIQSPGKVSPISLRREPAEENNRREIVAAAQGVRRAHDAALALLHDDGADVLKKLAAIHEEVSGLLRAIGN